MGSSLSLIVIPSEVAAATESRDLGFLETGNRKLETKNMPLIQITLLKGRTTEQKRKIAQRMTDVLVEEAKTAKEGVVVTFVDVDKDSYARGGELMLDKK